MANITKVALDAMGGDFAPLEPVLGAIAAVQAESSLIVYIVGDESKINSILVEHSYPKDQIIVVPTTEVIKTAEPAVNAVRRKKDSSLVVALNLVKKGEADGFVSAGSTGAVLVGGTVVVGRIKGIERAPLAALIPTRKGKTLLLDCGANVDARSNHLLQFALMGSIYMESIVGIKNPKVGLVNIGAEEEKGNALVKETFPLLKQSNLNFIGSVEARDIPEGGVDVIVAEAFVGNVVLKLMEGVASTLVALIKEGIKSTTKSKIGGLLVKSSLKKTLSMFDLSEHGGAPLLGLNGLVVKTHGSATAIEIKNSILQCIKFKEEGIRDKIKEALN